MEGSPFNQSARTARTPPPTPPISAPAAIPEASSRAQTNPVDPSKEAPLDLMSTPEIQKWLGSIEQCLNEVCQIANDGKLNSEQKMRVSSLCRKVGHGSSQMAVHYQSLKHKAMQNYSSYQHLKEQLDLSQRLQDLKVSIESSTKSTTGPSSFADMVKKGTNSFVQPTKTSSVLIYPNNKQQSSDETKTLVQKIICPEKMKLHVRSLRKIRNGGVIINTANKDDVEKIKLAPELLKSGLTVDERQKKRPRVVIIGVPSSMSEKEVVTCVYNQNLAECLPNHSLEAFLSSTKLSHKSGRKDAETCNFILEVSPDIRRALITKERVFVNWTSCPVRDFTLVTRCYKCQQYGHAAKFCRESMSTCGHCAELGHTIKECPKKTDAPKCATCFRFKKPHDHKTGCAECPAKGIAEQRYMNSIDYEGA